MRQPIAVLGLTVALAACTMHARTGNFGDDTPGDAVARAIDIQIVPALQSLRGVTVGHAACPEHLDVSLGKTGYCTLSVGESTVRIAVTGGHEYGKFFVKQADTVIDRPELRGAGRNHASAVTSLSIPSYNAAASVASEMRTKPSPLGPNALPGATATPRSRSSANAKSRLDRPLARTSAHT